MISEKSAGFSRLRLENLIFPWDQKMCMLFLTRSANPCTCNLRSLYGLSVVAIKGLTGSSYFLLISKIFVILLLTPNNRLSYLLLHRLTGKETFKETGLVFFCSFCLDFKFHSETSLFLILVLYLSLIIVQTRLEHF